MSYLAPEQFAEQAGIGQRAAQIAFHNAFSGKPWRGHSLPVVALPGQRGGASGMVWALNLDKASPDLRALLKLPETLPSMPIKRRLSARPNDRHVTTAADKQRIVAAILAHPKGSHERAAAFEDAALQPHKIGNGWQRFSERTLRDWVQAAELGGVAALMPVARSDMGKRRVRITRRWQNGCGLPEAIQEGIAAQWLCCTNRLVVGVPLAPGRPILRPL